MTTLINRRYEMTQMLVGSGSFGQCFLAIDKTTYKRCVLKVTKQLQGDIEANIQTEVRALEQLSHPHLTHGFDHFLLNNQFYIVMDYYDNNNLQSYIKRIPNPSPKQLRLWLAQIASAVNYLHSKQIIHRDLKLDNIFVSQDQKLFVGDFGTIGEIVNNRLSETYCVGTAIYQSPELIQHRPYGLKTDMWSIGCMLYEILAGKLPFNGQNLSTLCKQITNAQYEPLPQQYYAEFQPFLNGLFQIDQEKRWSSHDLCMQLQPELRELNLIQFLQIPPQMFLIEQIQPTELTQISLPQIEQNTEPKIQSSPQNDLMKVKELNAETPREQDADNSQDGIRTRLHEKIRKLTGDENVIYKLIMIQRKITEKQQIQRLLDYLNIKLTLDQIDFNNDNQAREALVKVINTLCPGKESQLIAELVRKISSDPVVE
ncbi:Kinase [Hexamita inflata]|uniref:non-specific serine/threonine protein kinase n=1 Tax=Hexamita inflata TaxID=28002 RepID=A0AA86S2Y8_9EUKA|nr:Kinase [Hexamita inflata]